MINKISEERQISHQATCIKAHDGNGLYLWTWYRNTLATFVYMYRSNNGNICCHKYLETVKQKRNKINQNFCIFERSGKLWIRLTFSSFNSKKLFRYFLKITFFFRSLLHLKISSQKIVNAKWLIVFLQQHSKISGSLALTPSILSWKSYFADDSHCPEFCSICLRNIWNWRSDSLN